MVNLVLGNLEEALLEEITDEHEKHHHVSCKLITIWAEKEQTIKER